MTPEPDLPLPVLHRYKTDDGNARLPACVLLHLDGKAAALKHPAAAALVAAGWAVSAPDLRATGETKPAGDAVRGAPDHNSAEHALWVGRPLLGQWVFDVQCLLDFLAIQPGLQKQRFAVVGIGQAGLVAVCAAALLDDRVSAGGRRGRPGELTSPSSPTPTGRTWGCWRRACCASATCRSWRPWPRRAA